MIDLHTHTTFSDGTLTPYELVASAKALGLSAIALTDHNTVEGLPEFLQAGRELGVRTVPGVELSTEFENTELHILALFLGEAHYGAITERLTDFRRRKERSNEQLVEALSQVGVHVDYQKLWRRSEGYLNRAVIAAELTALGYVASISEAFSRYLAPEAGFYRPASRPDARETIRFIRSLGAVAVLAHPYLNLSQEALLRFLPGAVESGLDAMETLYPKYDDATTALAGKTAAQFGILPCGGSDFHGANKPDISLGTGRGTLNVPDGVLASLIALKNSR